jgi:hypothetical protein
MENTIPRRAATSAGSSRHAPRPRLINTPVGFIAYLVRRTLARDRDNMYHQMPTRIAASLIKPRVSIVNSDSERAIVKGKQNI